MACSIGLVAVADEDSGLAIIDVSQPANARILHQISVGGSIVAVATGGNIAYALSKNGQIFSVDMTSGAILSRWVLSPQLRSAAATLDLFIAGDRLYALTSAGFDAFAINDDGLNLLGTVPSPRVGSPFGRLFIGNDIAYATRFSGFDTFDVRDPAQGKLLGTGSSQQIGWKQIVSNGSGLGVAMVGPNAGDDATVDVYLHDIRNPASNDVFVTSFPTPGAAQAVSIYNGLAYVADGASGLQVVNYLAYDSGGVPPSISLSANFPLNPAQVTENSSARVTALATDDVQVRNVEFYLDDVLVASDGNFPFELRFTTPLIQTGKTSFRGNFTWSGETTVTLSPDSTPPKVTHMAPRSAGVVVKEVTAFFNEQIDPASLTGSAVRLFAAGADGKLGTADDVPVAGGNLSAGTDRRAATLSLPAVLPFGNYRIIVGRDIADVRGNHLAAEVTSDFRVIDAVYWTNPGGGDWSEPENWSTGRVPGPNDDVLISTPTAATVTHSHGNDSIKSLITENPLILSGGRLEVANTMEVNHLFQLAVGTLAHATLIAGDSPNAFVQVLNYGYLETGERFSLIREKQ